MLNSYRLAELATLLCMLQFPMNMLSIVLMATSVLLSSYAACAEEPTVGSKCANPKLRSELLRMAKVDQQARQRATRSSASSGEELQRISQEIDKPNTRRLKEIVDKYGWPGKTLVGEDGSHAAWLLVQHAGQDEMAFLERVLARMKEGATTGEVALHDVAYLGDRIAMYQKKPQRYGTQYTEAADGSMVLHPIEDEAHVDERRAEVGLSTMAEQEKQMSKLYGKPVGISR